MSMGVATALIVAQALGLAALLVVVVVLSRRVRFLRGELERRVCAEPRPAAPPPERTPARALVPGGPRGLRVREDGGMGGRMQPTLGSEATLIQVPDLGAGFRRGESDDLAGALSARFREIWSGAERGLTAAQICEQTGQPPGLVELVLGLRRQLVASRER